MDMGTDKVKDIDVDMDIDTEIFKHRCFFNTGTLAQKFMQAGTRS